MNLKKDESQEQSAPFSQLHTFTFSQVDTPLRLDAYLAERLKIYSRTFCKHLITGGCVTIDGTPVIKASSRLAGPAQVSVHIHKNSPKPVDTSLCWPAQMIVERVFEHEDFLILNKPAFLLVHAATTRAGEHTLVDWVRIHIGGMNEDLLRARAGIIHRLDRDTSGLIVIVKNARAEKAFSVMFKQKTITKVYHAVVSGHPAQQGSIDFRIVRHPTKRVLMTHSRSIGREALTHYQVKKFFANAALIEAAPVTGRTHQIRVHCAAIGHPLLGDSLYGSFSPLIKRHALHATSLSFWYEGTFYHIHRRPPEDFTALITSLGDAL